MELSGRNQETTTRFSALLTNHHKREGALGVDLERESGRILEIASAHRLSWLHLDAVPGALKVIYWSKLVHLI